MPKTVIKFKIKFKDGKTLNGEVEFKSSGSRFLDLPTSSKKSFFCDELAKLPYNVVIPTDQIDFPETKQDTNDINIELQLPGSKNEHTSFHIYGGEDVTPSVSDYIPGKHSPEMKDSKDEKYDGTRPFKKLIDLINSSSDEQKIIAALPYSLDYNNLEILDQALRNSRFEVARNLLLHRLPRNLNLARCLYPENELRHHLRHPIIQDVCVQRIDTLEKLVKAADSAYGTDHRDRNWRTSDSLKLFLRDVPQLAYLVFNPKRNVLELSDNAAIASRFPTSLSPSLIRLILEYDPNRYYDSSRDIVGPDQVSSPHHAISYSGLGVKSFDVISFHHDEYGSYILMVFSNFETAEKFLKQLNNKKTSDITIDPNLLYFQGTNAFHLPAQRRDIHRGGCHYFLRTIAGIRLAIATASAHGLINTQLCTLLNRYCSYYTGPTNFFVARVFNTRELPSESTKITLINNENFSLFFSKHLGYYLSFKYADEYSCRKYIKGIKQLHDHGSITYCDSTEDRGFKYEDIARRDTCFYLKTPEGIINGLKELIYQEIIPEIDKALLQSLLDFINNTSLVSDDKYFQCTTRLRTYADGNFLDNNLGNLFSQKKHQQQARDLLLTLEACANKRPSLLKYLIEKGAPQKAETEGDFSKALIQLSGLTNAAPIKELKGDGRSSSPNQEQPQQNSGSVATGLSQHAIVCSSSRSPTTTSSTSSGTSSSSSASKSSVALKLP